MKKGLLRLDLRKDRLGRPKYQRLRDHLANEMLAGRLKPGQAIPSENTLVQSLGLARMTVRQAMVSLESDGLIRRVQGKGNFVHEEARRKLKRGLDVFALVVPETREGFYPSLLHGFETAAAELHHQTIICRTADDVGRQAGIILQLIDKKVGGVAINPTTPQPTPAYQIRQVQERGIPVVLCHRGVEGISAPLLALPYREIGRLAGKTLAEHGHRKAAFFTAQPSPAVRQREEGLQEAGREGGCDLRVESVYLVERPIKAREESCWAALREVFAGLDPPTAIFTSFDSMAEMIYLMLPRLGLRVPQDVSLLGCGGSWRDSALIRQITSVVVDELALGQKAVALLHEMRRGDRAIDDNEQFTMELSLSDGQTLAPPTAKTIPAS
jgi:GntR family transcriptional regulator, arabinose operon transcriptional repressor